MKDQIIQINLVPNMSTPAVVRVSQYDVGRPLVFKVYDGTSPADLTGVTAVIEGTKKSGLGFSESGTVTDNTVTLNTTLAMTQESGMIPTEIRFSKTGEDIGTANFILAVEKSPHLEGTTDGTHETMADLQSQLDALDERVEAIEGGGGGLTEAVKSAMLQIAQKVAYIDEHGQTYYDALYDALYPPAELVSISAVYTQTISVYPDTSLDDLRPDLVVTAHYDDSSTRTVSQYMLSGTLEVGTSTITVSYGGKSTTFEVTVSRGTDYGEDALANATWESGKGYNISTGALVTRSGAYATEKFSVQDLSYSVRNLDTTNNTNYYILLWDENDNYLGYKQYSDARFQWKPEYKIAVEVRNSGTFDPATMTMLPYDKRATAVSEFEIDIAGMANSVVKANGYYELNVKSAMAEVGVNSSNYNDTINRQSIIGMIGQSVYPNNFPFKSPIRIGTFNYSTNMLLSINVEGITVSDANLPTLKQYLVDNNVKIQYNY